ncbi:helix-turn-helix domain-containing protein [Zavarzinia sp.]|uniref:AlbA family DNA-binding domain-containing protein n=1 Tax=Zavarzinia sp. TaxID=2027920 RepID=UPI0035630E9D
MTLQYVLLDAINESHLKRLIEAKVPEARNIEYKLKSYGDGERDRAEWLADVTSFANTAGGDIIIGMKEIAGVPTGIFCLDVDVDKEILRLEQMAQFNIEPRIAGLSFRRVPVTGGEILIIRVPRSFNPPHRVVRNGTGGNRFWARSSAGKYEPNVEELRSLFNFAPHLADRIRDFRFDRLAKITADLIPVKMIDRARIIIHVVPYSSLNPACSPISLAAINSNPHNFSPIGSRSAGNWWVNFDGIFLPSNADAASPTQRAYTQVYRNGRLEAVASSISKVGGQREERPRLATIDIEGYILMGIVRYLKGLKVLDVEPPFVVMVSLVGVKGTQIGVGLHGIADDISTLSEDQYHFSEVLFDSVPNSIQECGVMMRPLIEQLANTAGAVASASYGPTGEYLHPFS